MPGVSDLRVTGENFRVGIVRRPWVPDLGMAESLLPPNLAKLVGRLCPGFLKHLGVFSLRRDIGEGGRGWGPSRAGHDEAGQPSPDRVGG
jgi:hypothetical protein